MDTKLKKSRPFLVWLSFFIGANILLFFASGTIVLWTDLSSNFSDITAILRYDYKDSSPFKDAISGQFMRLMEAVTRNAKAGDNSAGTLDSAEAEGVNLIYYARNSKTGKTVTNTSVEKLGLSEKGIGKLPDGYDYYLYFDGAKFSGKNNNKVLDLYRNDSGYWNKFVAYLAGNVFATNPQLKDTVALLIMKKDIVENPYAYSTFFQIKKDTNYARFMIYGAIAIFLLGLVLVILSIIKRKSKQEFEQKLAGFTGWFWVEIKACMSIFAIVISVRFLSDGFRFYEFPVKSIVTTGFLWWAYLLFIDLWINRKKVFANNSINSVIKLYKKSESSKPFQKYMLQRAYLLIVAEAILVFFVNAFCIAAVIRSESINLIPVLIFFAACVFLLYRYIRKYTGTVKDMGLLVDQIHDIKNGDMSVKNAINPGADLFGVQENLNSIQEGIGKAVEEKTRSEQMKMELITNVSHDLKTPLTSIISYVDLLSKENDLPPHVMDYIKILSQKSDRLKTLIQDLFDLSKASSGDIRLDMERLDLGKLIRQTLADMDEQVVQSGLAMKVNIPEEPVCVMSDGSKLYRVFQNLFSNALKYSLAGSRVYVDLLVKGNDVSAIIKNTAAYEMNFAEEEILERFARGDQARSTEGSGLGLAIARSFTHACGGQFVIKIDGDLFKVLVSFKVARQ